MPTVDHTSHSQIDEIIRLKSLGGVGLYQEGFKSSCYLCRYLLRFTRLRDHFSRFWRGDGAHA